MGAAKALNFVNLLFAVLVWALAVVALNGVNFRKQAITTSCMQYCEGKTGSGDQTVSVYANLWGTCLARVKLAPTPQVDTTPRRPHTCGPED